MVNKNPISLQIHPGLTSLHKNNKGLQWADIINKLKKKKAVTGTINQFTFHKLLLKFSKKELKD